LDNIIPSFTASQYLYLVFKVSHNKYKYVYNVSYLLTHVTLKQTLGNFEVRHPRCVGSITKNFCVLHLQSNTTIFPLVVQ